MFTGIAHVCFKVRNLDTMIEFYVNRIGLKKAFDFVDKEGKIYGAYLHVGGRTFIELFQGNNPQSSTEQNTYGHLCLEVADINTATAQLKSRGVAMGEVKLEMDHAYQVWFADPEGNQIELHQYTPQSWQIPHLR